MDSASGEAAGAAELIVGRSDSGVEDELFGCLQGDDLGAGDRLLPGAGGQSDQWGLRGKGDDVEDRLGGVYDLGREGQVAGQRSTGHSDRRGVDDQTWPERADLGGGQEAVLLGQAMPGGLAAGDDVATTEPAVA